MSKYNLKGKKREEMIISHLQLQLADHNRQRGNTQKAQSFQRLRAFLLLSPIFLVAMLVIFLLILHIHYK